MTNTIQKKFKVSSTQLLYQSCPYQALTLFIIGPFLDGLLTNKNVFAFKYTPYVLVKWLSILFFFRPLQLIFILFIITILCIIMIAVLHCTIVLDICFCKLQHVFGNWKDISSHISGPRTSENMLGSSIWLCSSSWSIQLAQHFGYPDCRNWDGTLFVLLQSWEPAEG